MILNPWGEVKRLKAALKKQTLATEAWCESMAYHADRLNHAEDALYAILAEETPKANATVKRMARLAEEGLEE
jgi:hypothetical protein